jgi:non-ribosomal peptide synthetase component F
MFVLQNAPASVLRLPGLTLAPVRLDDGQSAFDLTLFVGDSAGRPLTGALEYNTALFNDSTVARMAEQFLHLLTEIAADPGREIAGLSTSPEEESRALVFSFNDDLG